MKSQHKERGRELLALKAVEGLPSYEQLELDLLLADTPELAAESMDRAVAAIELAFTAPEPMPGNLRERLSAQAAAHLADPSAERSTADVLPFPRRASNEPSARSTTSKMGWWAAAACLALAVAGWWPSSQAPLAPAPDGSGQIAVTEPSAEEKASRLASLDDTIVRSWERTEDPLANQVIGEVIWNPSKQEGYMRFRGLPVNDPEQFQYQLWIFDVQQDERFPIDGGVFDASVEGELIIPIINKLDVSAATLFAVTVEKPGGVVVSNRDRLVVLAET